MAYSVKQLAEIAGVSARTLHYYDEIALLSPERERGNGYRRYDWDGLIRLQQILFYKELGLELKEIKAMLDTPGFDVLDALEQHKADLEGRATRLLNLLDTVENTIQLLKGETIMSDNDLFNGFDEAKQKAYEKEAFDRWGHHNPDAFQQSQQRWGGLEADGRQAHLDEGKAITVGLAELLDRDPADADVQALVKRQHDWVNFFWDCDLEAFEAMGDLYAGDPQFRANFASVHPELPDFLHEAIQHYVQQG